VKSWTDLLPEVYNYFCFKGLLSLLISSSDWLESEKSYPF